MHAKDRMAHDKLTKGIEGFSKALEDLEKLLGQAPQRTRTTRKRLSTINYKKAPQRCAYTTLRGFLG